MCDLPPPSLLISFSAQFGLIFEFISDMDAFSSFERNSRETRKPLAAQFNLISFCGQCCEFMKFFGLRFMLMVSTRSRFARFH